MSIEYKALMKSRQNLYRFLGNVYQKEIDSAALDCIKVMAFPAECCEPEMEEGYLLLKSSLAAMGKDAVLELAVDYARTFLGAGIAQGSTAFPYESVYTSKKGIVMQEAWEQVRGIYASKGLSKGHVTSDILEDHIAMELEYMSYLCGEANDNPENIQLLTEQRAFLNTHLLNWVPKFCADVEKYAETDFYKAIAKITAGFLKLDKSLLDSIIAFYSSKGEETMSRRVSIQRMDEILRELQSDYRIYAPTHSASKGGKTGAQLVRYGEITSAKDIVLDVQSDFSPKEVFYPISQTMFYFKDGKTVDSTCDDSKGSIIFMRPCDINALKRLDKIFLENGNMADCYYKRMRERIKIFMIECREGFDNCFCVSMGSNRTDNYSAAFRFENDSVLVNLNNHELTKYFENEAQADFAPEFVQENRKKAVLPVIEDRELLKEAAGLEFWKEYDNRCIGCGGCNTVCPTCSCFDTVDIIYNETSPDGERRRVWSSCMLDTFTLTAGGARARKTHGANMRFKTLHKVYDYNLRFGGDEHMCVGCGRCDQRCPKEISFFDTINRFSQELEALKAAKSAASEVK